MSTSSIISGVDAAPGDDAGIDADVVGVVAVGWALGGAFDVVFGVDEQANPAIARQIKSAM